MQKACLTAIYLICVNLNFSHAQVANEQEIEILIERHNFWRADVGVGEINYSNELAEVALTWAKELKKQGCVFKHSSVKYGENLFKGTSGFYTVADAIDAWGEEKKDYNYEKNKCKRGEMCGHYTQIVWQSTSLVGCAKIECDGYITWVCNYDPPGNWVGEKPY